MLTRLEVNGFKNLIDFSVDFGPFTCITGPGGVGKSNLFDAIQFLSLLTELPINEAASRIRNPGREPGDVADLFFFNGSQRVDRIEIAAEMVIRGKVNDDFGRDAEASSSFLRYEVAFRHAPPSSVDGSIGGVILEREELRPIIEARAARHLKFPHSKSRFRDGAVYNSRHARSGFISTSDDPETGQPVVMVHQDGGFPARGKPSPAIGARRTAVGTENTAATPTVLATKREMQSWRVVNLDPVAMRRPDRYNQPPGVASDGAHMPATLHHWISTAQEHGHDPDSALDRLTASICDVVPVGKVSVLREDVLGLLSLELEEPSGITFGASTVSDSTLRFLVFAAFAQTPAPPSLLCIESPETGLALDSLDALNSILHQMAANPHEEIGPDNPLRQVIVVSQSPYLLQSQEMQDLLLAQPLWSTVAGSDPNQHILRCRPHAGTWRCADPEDGIDLTSVVTYPLPAQKLQIGFPSQFWNDA